MALQTAIGAATFSRLAITDTAQTVLPTTEAALIALFATADNFIEIKNVREFPDNMGTPPNIVKVPEYGRRTSVSIGAQPDAPDLELMLNYVPADWAPSTALSQMINNKTQVVFQFSLLYAPAPSLLTTAAGLGAVPNANYYWLGRLESLQFGPSLSDANQATVAISIQSDFVGPFTIAPT